MEPELEKAIRRVYPDGTIYSLDKKGLENPERDERIKTVVSYVESECGISHEVDIFNKPAYKLSFSDASQPMMNQWTLGMKKQEKLNWIKNHKDPYTILWLKISRVADFYYTFFNHWRLRPDENHFDVDFSNKPNSEWKLRQNIIEDTLQRNGFKFFSPQYREQKTPFLLGRDDSIAEDDPRWEDDNFDPPLVPSTLHQALFSY